MEQPSGGSQLDRDKKGKGSESIWQFVNPLWMWRARPKDCDGPRSICPGLLFLPGCMALIAFHAVTMGTFVGLVLFKGYKNVYLWNLAPLAPVWIFLCGADIKFRLQGADKDQRGVFDNAVINWVGIITFIPSVIVSIVMFISFIITVARKLWA